MKNYQAPTLADEIDAAQQAIDAADREMRNLRAHIACLGACRSQEDRQGVAAQVRRSARIVSALVAQADESTSKVARHSDSDSDLRLVS